MSHPNQEDQTTPIYCHTTSCQRRTLVTCCEEKLTMRTRGTAGPPTCSMEITRSLVNFNKRYTRFALIHIPRGRPDAHKVRCTRICGTFLCLRKKSNPNGYVFCSAKYQGHCSLLQLLGKCNAQNQLCL